MTLTPLRLVNATVLRSGGLDTDPISLCNGRIATDGGREVDLSGYLILPGIVDIHGDAFERHLAPRRGVVTDPRAGLAAVEAELSANGITTAWLAQFWSWEGGMRSPDFAATLCAALERYGAMPDIRVQLRLELGCHDAFEAASDLIARYGIGYVVLNDHLPHEALAARKRPPRLEGQALKSRRSPADHLALMQRLHAEMPVARTRLAALAADLKNRDVILGSHDDHDAETRAWYRGLGVDISEFPTSEAAAMAAQAAGDPVVMGAPNALRGGSHARGVSAAALIEMGAVSALASDYHYPALAQSAFRLAETGLPLAEAWALISTNPARMMGLNDRGDLTAGQRADLVIVETATKRIAGTIANGQIAYLSGPLAHRLIGGDA